MRDYKAYIFSMLCRVAVAIYYLIYNNYVKYSTIVISSTAINVLHLGTAR